MPELDWDNNELPIVKREYYSALKQLGTLGGGNHFIEIQKGDDGYIWIMIHSGSRNIGYKVANHYNKLAIEINKKWHTQVPEKWELAFLPLESEEGQEYLREMQYCVDFALANRELMMSRIKLSIDEVVDGVIYEDLINIAHNYASLEHHFGENVMVHRKGATLAREGITGIIPGSQGTKSYIVAGKGNPESFMSCSHGAGRTMSRTKARNELNLEEEKRKLDEQGIIHAIRNKSDLDEASSAYKDIDVVMENQKDLVDILVELTPLAVIKG
jgi:tRNA-splicing ligase RtcB